MLPRADTERREFGGRRSRSRSLGRARRGQGDLRRDGRRRRRERHARHFPCRRSRRGQRHREQRDEEPARRGENCDQTDDPTATPTDYWRLLHRPIMQIHRRPSSQLDVDLTHQVPKRYVDWMAVARRVELQLLPINRGPGFSWPVRYPISSTFTPMTSFAFSTSCCTSTFPLLIRPASTPTRRSA